MYTNKNNRNKEMQKRYGHLLDKYINAADYPNPIFHKETSENIKDVENGRYGHLLENTSDPAQETYDRMMRMQDMIMENRDRRAKEEERAELIAKGRIQVEKINEKKHADRIQSFANGLLERKKAKIEAEAAQREEEKRRAREEKERIERFRHQTDSLNETREITARAKEVMERRKKQEKSITGRWNGTEIRSVDNGFYGAYRIEISGVPHFFTVFDVDFVYIAFVGLKWLCFGTIIVIIIEEKVRCMIMIPDGAIASGVISKIINDLADVSKSKIKKAVEDKKNEHKSLESQLYNLIVSVLNEMNDNPYEKNSDKIYDTAEKLLIGFQKYGREDEEAVKYALKNILSCVDDDKCMEFKTLLIHEISKEEYNELYREIRLLQEEKEYKKTDRIERKVDHLDQKLDDIRKNDERIIRNTDKAEKFQNNKKQDYIDNWNSRLFLHIDNNERPLTLADAFIMPHYEYHIKDRRMNFSDIDTMNEVIEKFMKYDRSSNMLITGVPGIGKTSIVSWVANEYKENGDIIILRFRDWEKEELKAGLLKAICNVLNCIKRDLEGKIIVLDGFDEIKILSKGKDLLINFFNEILDYRNLKIIVTSRPDYIETNKFQYIFKLLPFQINEIKQFYQIIKGTVLESNLQDHNFDVLGIPVILYMAIMADIDITENATKSELYTKIFAEKGGIFDKFSFNGFGYDYGEQILREGNNAKKYLDFLKDVSFQMFEKNRLVLMQGEYKVPELVFQDANISILEFPIKHLFESTELSIEFVHKSIFEYFLSEYIFESIRNTINTSKEELACSFGILFKRNVLYKDIEEFLAYRIKNSELYEKYKFVNASFRLMLQDGMTYHANEHYKNIVKCEMKVFANMLRVLHLWQKPVYLQSFRYLKYNTGIKLDLSGIDFQKKHLIGIDLRRSDLKGANLKDAFFRRMDLREVNLSGANISGLDLSGSDIRGAILDDTIFDTLILRGTIIDESQADYLKGKCDLQDVKVYLRRNKEIVSYEEYCRNKQ